MLSRVLDLFLFLDFVVDRFYEKVYFVFELFDNAIGLLKFIVYLSLYFFDVLKRLVQIMVSR